MYICLNPSFISREYTYESLVLLLSNIILINRETTEINNDNINVLNCEYYDIQVNLRRDDISLYIKLSNIENSPNWLKSVVFYGFEEEIENDFCSRNRFIQRISYEGMSSVKRVGNSCTSYCESLISTLCHLLISMV